MNDRKTSYNARFANKTIKEIILILTKDVAAHLYGHKWLFAVSVSHLATMSPTFSLTDSELNVTKAKQT